MVDKIIPPRRNETLTQGGIGLLRFMEYIERSTSQVNASTEANEADPSTVNLSAGAISAVNKLVKELQNDLPPSNNAEVGALNKRIEQLENAPSINAQLSAMAKKIEELQGVIQAPATRTKFKKLTVGNLTVDTLTPKTILGGSIVANNVDQIVNIRSANDNNLVCQIVANETLNSLQFRINGSATEYFEINDNGVELVGSGLLLKGDTAEVTTDINGPSGNWDVDGIDLDSGDSYKVAGTQVLQGQGAAVPDAAGGVTIDAEARTAVNDLLARVRAHGLIA